MYTRPILGLDRNSVFCSPPENMADAPFQGPDLSQNFVTFTMSMASLLIVSIALRFLSIILTKPKIAHFSRFWWDDWAALAAAVSIHLSLTNDELVVY